MYFSYGQERLNIISAITQFYILEELSLQNQPIFLMQRKKWGDLVMDVNSALNELTKKLARTLFDYLCVSSLGEARHASAQAKRYRLKDYFTNSSTRETVYSNTEHYNPVQFLPVLKKLFFYGNWAGGGFGGEKWGNIINAALMYGSVPDKVFIDHIIDLCHNGGTAFDKPTIVFLSQKSPFNRILEMKFSCESFIKTIVESDTYVEVSDLIIRLIKRMSEFNPTFPPKSILFQPIPFVFPVPKVWGKDSLLLELREDHEYLESVGHKIIFGISSILKEESNINLKLEDLLKSVKRTLTSFNKTIALNEVEDEGEDEEEDTKIKVKLKISKPSLKTEKTIKPKKAQETPSNLKNTVDKIDKTPKEIIDKTLLKEIIDKTLKEIKEKEKENDSNTEERED